MKTTQLTQTATAQPENNAKVYWRDINASKDEIKYNGTAFSSNGRLIYWHGHEASEAQNWLADEAQIQRRKSESKIKPVAFDSIRPSPTAHGYSNLFPAPKGLPKLSKGESAHTPLSKDERQAQDDGRTNFGSDWPYRDLKRKYEETAAERDQLREQVRELLAACKEIDAIGQFVSDDKEACDRMLKIAIAAIKHAEEAQP